MMVLMPPPLILWESIQNFAAFFIFFWLLAVVAHHMFCRKFTWYQNKVLQGSIQVSFGRIYLTSHSLNAPIQAIGSWPRLVKLWRIWFICGVIVSSILIIPVFLFLIYLFIGHTVRLMRWYYVVPVSSVSSASPIFVPSTTPSVSVSLMPIVPGVNLPVPNILPFFISLLFSTFFHELGHGLSAASEYTDVDGVGVALLGVFPAAFVVVKNLDSQALARQLRIMAAGVWHNIVLAVFAAFLLWNMPAIINPFFPQGRGVTIVGLIESRAVSNHTIAFHRGMEIYSINNCSVSSPKSLERCSINYTKPGFCLSVDQMKQARDDFLPPVQVGSTGSTVLECCKNLSSSLCFREDAAISSPECLQVRKVIQGTTSSQPRQHQPIPRRCNSSLDCSDSQCYIPYLGSSERLLIFNTSTGPVLFVGDSYGLLRSLRVSIYAQGSWLPLWLPDVLEMTLKYFVSISAALAVLNLVPSFGLDGCRFAELWLSLLFRYGFLPARFSRFQSRIVQILTVVSTFFLVADILLGFTQM
ncbi:putative Membrane-bound transcription factor site-2 protease [Hypsibius exemplaris]|uniref:Membrane-bound transcription factor site-2 protease n=1 Tax=Hypsibius exemplaris TaxID=2072580 RepID=A0A1W0X6Y7_HYPEX|nr:putative Membrane-bound transcription factor site-2 protease [Hypsibius exemplaris]